MQLGGVGSETRTRPPYLAVAASLVVLAGIGALVAINTNDATPVAPAAAPIATDDPSASEPVPAPTTTTVLSDTTPSCAITGAQALVPNVAGMPWGMPPPSSRPQGSNPTQSLSFPHPLRHRIPTTSSFDKRLRPERSHRAAPPSTSRSHTNLAPSTSCKRVTRTSRSRTRRAPRSNNSSNSTPCPLPNSKPPAEAPPPSSHSDRPYASALAPPRRSARDQAMTSRHRTRFLTPQHRAPLLQPPRCRDRKGGPNCLAADRSWARPRDFRASHPGRTVRVDRVSGAGYRSALLSALHRHTSAAVSVCRTARMRPDLASNPSRCLDGRCGMTAIVSRPPVCRIGPGGRRVGGT